MHNARSSPSIKKDYSGKYVGNRVVLRFSRFAKFNDPLWLVRCTCGHEFESLSQDLKRKECRNCRMKHNRKRRFESLYNTFIYKTKKRGLSTDISYEDFLLFTQTPSCHYCDAPIVWSEFQSKSTKRQAYNLDRKDSRQSYTKNNLVVCCPRCNLSKNNLFSYAEWKKIGELIKSWRESANVIHTGV